MATTSPSPSPGQTPGLQSRLQPLAQQTRYKHLCFVRRTRPHSTPVWICRRSGTSSQLGVIVVGEPWPTWTFEPDDDTLFTSDQLNDILLFIRQATL